MKTKKSPAQSSLKCHGLSRCHIKCHNVQPAAGKHRLWADVVFWLQPYHHKRMPFITIPSGPLMCQRSCACEPFPFLAHSRQDQQDRCKQFKYEVCANLFHTNKSGESLSRPAQARERTETVTAAVRQGTARNAKAAASSCWHPGSSVHL